MTASDTVTGSWPAVAASVPAARQMLREHLRRRGEDALADNAELLVSELVGNVVLHVGGAVSVTATTSPGEVLVEVRDESRVAPQVRMYSPTSSTGRGMRLVHSLSAEHGVRVVDGGKAVWVRITRATTARGEDELAESFSDVDWLAELVDVQPAEDTPLRTGAAVPEQVARTHAERAAEAAAQATRPHRERAAGAPEQASRPQPERAT